MLKLGLHQEKKSLREMDRHDFILVMKTLGYGVTQLQAIEVLITKGWVIKQLGILYTPPITAEGKD